ncbi:MAG: hypothetical protein ACRDG3_02285 [Tepidiformaceae bacterium]
MERGIGRWRQPMAQFARRLLATETALFAVCLGLALWQGWSAGVLAAAILIGGLALGALGILPLFLGSPPNTTALLNGMQGFQVIDLRADLGAQMPAGGDETILRNDMQRANRAIPRSISLIAAAVLSFGVAYVVSLL